MTASDAAVHPDLVDADAEVGEELLCFGFERAVEVVGEFVKLTGDAPKLDVITGDVFGAEGVSPESFAGWVDGAADGDGVPGQAGVAVE